MPRPILQTLALLTALFCAAPAQAETVKLNGYLGLRYSDEDERALVGGRDTNFSQQAQGSIKITLPQNLTAFAQARALHTTGDAGLDDGTGRTLSRDQSFFELRQFWLRKENLGGNLPLYAQIGRQRIKEERGFWWNENIDALRLGYNGTLWRGFIALAENFSAYRLGHENAFAQEDQSRLRLLGEAAYQYRYNHFIEARALLERDHSGLEPTGAVIDANDRDDEDLSALWLGFRARGTKGALHYHAEVAALTADAKNITTAAGPAATQRTVTGAARSTRAALAFDSTVTLDTTLPLSPSFSAGYAYGSADFRQSGLEGASARKNYGMVLRPELSNLHIFTTGVSIPVAKTSRAGLKYYNYRLARSGSALGNNGISAALSGTDPDLGQAVDATLDLALTEKTNLNLALGTYYPGPAYTNGVQNTALRFLMELKIHY